MSAVRRSVTFLILTGVLICQSVRSLAQENQPKISPGAIEIIDTSEYVPSFYDDAINYNLMIASSRGYVSEIRRLVESGANINTETDEGATPLIFAVSSNKADAVDEILSYGPAVDKLTSAYETPLILAVRNGNLRICESLIRAGADLDFTDNSGSAPLHYAALNGDLEITDLLLYYNASIDQKTDEGLTPLHSSVLTGNANVADLLLQNGANPETRNKEGFTPFLLAAYKGDTLIMDMLVRRDINIYEVNNAGYNALDLAISADQPEAVGYLIRIGKKWAEPGGNAISPYTVATKYHRKDMVDLLRNNGIAGDIKLGIDQYAISLSSRFMTRDFYTGLSISFKEPFLNAGFTAGFDLKLWYTRVMSKESEHLFIQYHSKDYLVYAGVFKDFILHEKPMKSSIMLTGSLMAGYSFGYTFKGTKTVPDNSLKFIPDVTLKWNIRNFALSLGMEYIRSEYYRIGPVWLRAGCSYTLFFDRIRARVKPDKWY